jgi:hypothetical protein
MQYNEFIQALQSGIAAAVSPVMEPMPEATKSESPEAAQATMVPFVSLVDHTMQSSTVWPERAASSAVRNLQATQSSRGSCAVVVQ